MAQLKAAVDRLVTGQRENWPCWLAIGISIGILLYFALPLEPAPWLPVAGIAASGVLVLAACLVRRVRPILWGAAPLLIVALGFGAATLRTWKMQPHFLTAPLSGVAVFGRVAQIEPLPSGGRLTLAPAYLGRAAAPAGTTPLHLQITVLTANDDLQPGDWVRLRADLHPPSGPAAPAAFDFRRQAFFAGIDGIGFSYAARQAEPPVDLGGKRDARWLDDWADRLRQRITQRINDILPDDSAALSIALVVGNQTALRKADMSAMRDSGLSHLLSISGLHISLAAGIMFFSCRFILALIPWLALRAPTKKWAAILALLGAAFYALLAGAAEPSLSGSVVPTQRSLLMTLIVFSAILLDRSPISLRLVAWSAVLLMLWQPESVIGPSFEMSFAAVFALIAGFDALRPHLLALRRKLSSPPVDMVGRVLGYGGFALFWLFGLMLSSLIATLATAPFGLFHFDRLQVYGIAANMLAVPLTGIWLMPAAVLALLAMPFGLDAPFWHLLGWGCDVILRIGHVVQLWPQAVIPVPAMPAWGVLAVSAGLIWICLGHGWNRAIGLLGAAAMVLSMTTVRQPDILLSETGRLVAAQDTSGQLVVSSNRIERRVRETWLHRRAQSRSDTFDSLSDQSNWVSCDYADDCRLLVAGHKVAFDLGRVPGDLSCESADVVIVPQRRVRCSSTGNRDAPLILDQRNLPQLGAVAIYFDRESIRVETTAQTIGQRPWSAFRKSDPPTPDDDASDEGEPEAAQ